MTEFYRLLSQLLLMKSITDMQGYSYKQIVINGPFLSLCGERQRVFSFTGAQARGTSVRATALAMSQTRILALTRVPLRKKQTKISFCR